MPENIPRLRPLKIKPSGPSGPPGPSGGEGEGFPRPLSPPKPASPREGMGGKEPFPKGGIVPGIAYNGAPVYETVTKNSYDDKFCSPRYWPGAKRPTRAPLEVTLERLHPRSPRVWQGGGQPPLSPRNAGNLGDGSTEIAHDIAQRDRRVYYHVAHQRTLQRW